VLGQRVFCRGCAVVLPVITLRAVLVVPFLIQARGVNLLLGCVPMLAQEVWAAVAVAIYTAVW
jgi:hypothetical protein